MPLQSLERGLQSPHESVVSKPALIRGVLDALKQGQSDQAAALYSRSKEDVGYDLMNAVAGGELAAPLASLFVSARDYYKAAQVFEKLEMMADAAQNFENAGAFGEAAELYARIGDVANAAEMLERGGSYPRAAPLFEQAGQWLDAARNYEKAEEPFLAGRAYAEAGDRKKALECLQKVQAGDDAYAEAVALLGPILEEMGFQELALQKYREAVHDEPVGAENVPAYYRLALAFQTSGQLDEARATFAKILEFDLNYEDVQDRYRTLKEGAPPLSQAPASASAPAEAVVVMHEDRSLFGDSVLFRELTFEEMRGLLELTETRSFKRGELLLKEGNLVPGLVLVRRGEIAIGMNLQGKDVRLATLRPGAHLGEMTVQGEHHSRITAVAASDGDCIVVPGERLRAFLARNPRLSAKLTKNLMAAMDVHLTQVKEVIKSLWAAKR